MFNQNALEPMQVDFYPTDYENYEKQHVHIVENTNLDLESYANNYTGLARLKRLMFIADHCPALRVEALKMAIWNVMETFDVGLYKTLHEKLVEASAGSTATLPDVAGGDRAISDMPLLNQTWIDDYTNKSLLKLNRLNAALRIYKNSFIKESIRRGYDNLGDHYLDCGDLYKAQKWYSSALDYCTSEKHVVNMCINLIKVSLHLRHWTDVSDWVVKAEQTSEFAKGKKKNNVTFTRLRCAAGIAELACGRYREAAQDFLQASLDRCDFPEVLSPNNVATYGGLCALATYDRNELQEKVILNSSFRQFLELDTPLRDIILKFYECKYATCLKLLDDIKNNLYLDMYIASHVTKLYSQIRNRALIQYFRPYLSADMRKMATAFNTTVPNLEDELMHLILDGHIQARIDSYNKILYANDVDQRGTTFKKTIAMGKQYTKSSHMLILRAAVIKHHIEVE